MNIAVEVEEIFSLQTLLTDPSSVVPQGKSLLSALAKSHKHKKDPLEDSVKQVVHRAFWDEAREALSSPLPTVQLPRLKNLYVDVHEAIAPLFPTNHPILAILTSPPAPTSSPLNSALVVIKDTLLALRQRCAPIRDESIDSLISSLSEASSPFSPSLAEFLVQKLQALLDLVDQIKSDFETFVLGTISEDQLRAVLFDNLKERQRKLVHTVCHGSEAVQGLWRTWIAQVSPAQSVPLFPHKRWIIRLFQAMQYDKPVYCPFVTSGNDSAPCNFSIPNELPPQLFFFTPFLVYAQNYLQAIVIAASLSSLTHLPPSPLSGLETSVFIDRIWTLLEAEIESDLRPTAHSNDTVGHTKLINLADEVVRAQQAFNFTSLQSEEENRLRAAVDRTIRAEDPVYLLLKKRLVIALESHIISSSDPPVSAIQSGIPNKMQTGTDMSGERAAKRSKLLLPEYPLLKSHPSQMGNVLGFDDPILRNAISHIAQKFVTCVTLTESIWGDLAI